MTTRQSNQVQQWKRYEFVRDYGIENVEADPRAAAAEMVRLGFYPPRTSLHSISNGLRRLCHEIRNGWKPRPLIPTPKDIVVMLTPKMNGGNARAIELTGDEAAMIWRGAQALLKK